MGRYPLILNWISIRKMLSSEILKGKFTNFNFSRMIFFDYRKMLPNCNQSTINFWIIKKLYYLNISSIFVQISNKIISSINELDECKAEIETLNNQYKILIEQQKNLSNDTIILENAKKQQEEYIKKIQGEIEQKKIKNQSTEKQNQLLRQQIQQLHLLTSILQKQYTVKCDQSKSNISLLNDLKVQNDKLQQRIFDLKLTFGTIMKDHQNNLIENQIRNSSIFLYQTQLNQGMDSLKKTKIQLDFAQNQQLKESENLIQVEHQLNIQISQNLRLRKQISNIDASIQNISKNVERSEDKKKRLIAQNNILNRTQYQLKQEIEKYLHRYQELEKLNKGLQNRFQNYIQCDQQVIDILNRKQSIENLLQQVKENLKHTEIDLY